MYVVVFRANCAEQDDEYYRTAERLQALGKERWYKSYRVEICELKVTHEELDLQR